MSLKNKKGFSLIEVICGMALLMIFSAAAFSISASSISLKRNNKEVEKGIIFAEALQKNILYNIPYKQILDMVNKEKIYIGSENMTLESLKNNHIEDIFNNSRPVEKPYLLLEIEEEEVLIIKIRLFTNFKNHEVIESKFYKGKYL